MRIKNIAAALEIMTQVQTAIGLTMIVLTVERNGGNHNKRYKMTVAELIAELSEMPPDAEVYYDGGEYRDNWISVYKINQQKHGTLGKAKGVYIE